VAVVLALICVVLLMYFIAHITSLIQSSTIVRTAHEATMEAIAGLDDLDESSVEGHDSKSRSSSENLFTDAPSVVVRASNSGYLQRLDIDAVFVAVAGHQQHMVVEIPFGPGDFVAAGLPLVRIWSTQEFSPNSDIEDKVHRAFVLEKERSFGQDFAFGLKQLSDIALRSLSPGVNDPTTAIQALDRMEAIFVALGEKALPPRVREREINGNRIVAEVGYYGFDDIVGLAFDQVRRAAVASGQVAVLERFLEVLERVIRANSSPERRRALWARAFTVARLAPQQIPDPYDALNLICRAVEVGAPLLKTELSTPVGSDLEELANISNELRGGERIRQAIDAAWSSLDR